jgi:AraC family transcriptional regulator of adaptative response / DNA-3-methyladenine glycosylase II
MQVNAEQTAAFAHRPGPAMRVKAVETEMEPDICWQAMRSRDRRFDGRFYVAAVTTGIYCRPICPVPFAKQNNIALFPCAAGAEAAGFRPCRRCHPETSPGTPAWLGTSAVVSRALRLIWDGALDGGSVDELAERVGIGSRQLRRLFMEHLGVPPIKIASTHRLHFARDLIEQTDMPMATIALNAGYKSIRQFNHAVRIAAGQSPSELRRIQGELPVTLRRGEFVMRLLYRPPFDWSALIAFLAARATPGVEVADEAFYSRTIDSDGGIGVIDVRPDLENAGLIVRMDLPKHEGLLRAVQRVRRIFDMGADPLEIAARLSSDGRLKPHLKQRPGLRVPGVWDGFEIAVRAVLGQSLVTADSPAVAGALVRKFGRAVNTSIEGLTHLFPRPEDLADAKLASLGIAKKTARSINALARTIVNGELTFALARTLQDTVSRLTAIEGISAETAHYIAMRAFGEPDAFPLDNKALTRALENDAVTAPPDDFLSIPEAWRPWRAYAAMHLLGAKTSL